MATTKFRGLAITLLALMLWAVAHVGAKCPLKIVGCKNRVQNGGACPFCLPDFTHFIDGGCNGTVGPDSCEQKCQDHFTKQTNLDTPYTFVRDANGKCTSCTAMPIRRTPVNNNCPAPDAECDNKEGCE